MPELGVGRLDLTLPFTIVYDIGQLTPQFGALVPHLSNKRIGFSCCYDYDYYKTLIQIQNIHHSYSHLPCWALNHVTLPLRSHN